MAAQLGFSRKSAAVGLGSAMILLFFSGDAHAYMDPGTGGLLYQLIIVFLAAITSYFAFFSGWIKRFFKKDTKEPVDDED